MRDRAKNILTKEITLFERSIPVLLIAIIAMGGLGSAALLQTYGTVDGTADAQQSVLVDGENYNGDQALVFDGTDVMAGTTIVERHDMHNQADVEAPVGFSMACKIVGNKATTSPSSMTDWSGDCEGIDTHVVEYYEDAGHNFGDYSASSGDLVVDDDDKSNYNDIQTAINDATTGQTVLVKAGIYSEDVTVNVSGVTLASGAQGAATVDGGFDITADDAAVKGFDIQGGFPELSNGGGAQEGIRVVANNAVVASNRISGLDIPDDEVQGVHVYGADNVHVGNNVITGLNTDGQGTSWGNGAYGVLVQDGSDNVTVTHNTVTDLHGTWSGAVSAGLTSSTAAVTDFAVTSNVFNDVTATGDATAFYTDGDDASTFTVEHNIFGSADFDLGSADSDATLDATDNYFHDGIQILDEDVDKRFDGTINASYETKSATTLDAGETDEFGIVNDFAVNLKPLDYHVDVQVIPN
jgi:hypothetical protein